MSVETGPGWEMRLGDSLDAIGVLGARSIDAIITDPPYSEHVDANFVTMGKHTAGKVRGRSRQEKVHRKEIGIGVMDTSAIMRFSMSAARITRGWILTFCAFEQMHEYRERLTNAGARYIRACAWEKPDATPQLTGDRPATWGECFVVAYGDRDAALSWNGRGKRGLYRAGVCRGHQRSDHPTQKPLDLMMQLVADFTNPGDLVCDPFSGSGTTGVACLRLGRRFLGWELQREWFDTACRRLRGDEASPRECQPSLFGGAA